MMTLTAAVIFTATILYAIRSGDLYYDAGLWDRLVRLGVGLFFVSITTGLVGRAQAGDSFEWFHWPILGAGVFMVAGYVGLLTSQRAALHRLAHKLGTLKACTNPDCVAGRAEVAHIAGRDHADH